MSDYDDPVALQTMLFVYHKHSVDKPGDEIWIEPLFETKEQCDRFLFRVLVSIPDAVLVRERSGAQGLHRYIFMAKNGYRSHAELASYQLLTSLDEEVFSKLLNTVYEQERWAWEKIRE